MKNDGHLDDATILAVEVELARGELTQRQIARRHAIGERSVRRIKTGEIRPRLAEEDESLPMRATRRALRVAAELGGQVGLELKKTHGAGYRRVVRRGGGERVYHGPFALPERGMRDEG